MLPDPRRTARVSLDDILAYADAHSPVLAVARSARARADAARVAASPRLPDNPVVEVGGGPRIAPDGTGVDVEVSVSQSFEIAGERRRRLAAAASLRRLTETEIEQARWDVHCDVHAAFHRALVLRERAVLATALLAFQQQMESAVERRAAAGETAPLTTRIAQLEVAQARQVSVAASQAYLAGRLELAQLAGWPATSPPEPVGHLDVPRDPPSLAHLVEVGRRRRPAYRRLAAAVREARARAHLAEREAWPRPAVGARYLLEGAAVPEGPSHVVLGTLALPLPIARTNQGERARARADVRVAETELRAAQATLEIELARGRAAITAAAERLRTYGADVLPRLEENLALLQRAFELGEIELLDALVARERFLRVQSDVLDAHLDYFESAAGLERALGVDVWPDEHGEGAHLR
ncbi:MAG: TolC family protein [Deltaproteobacteria bacterium]|nr:TolC family protein [Deltaproteobacteria bacterium]